MSQYKTKKDRKDSPKTILPTCYTKDTQKTFTKYVYMCIIT